MKHKTLFKTVAALALIALLFLTVSLCSKNEEPAVMSTPEPPPTATPVPVDWREVMVKAVVNGDNHGGLAAEYALGGSIQYDDLLLLSKIIACECGPAWEDWGVMAIGEVVLNRVASPEFPNTIREVLYQTNPMQYEPVWTDGWESYLPNERFVRLALRLLAGERIFDDPTIVFQALFTQGGGTVLAYHDDILDNNTYFCRTSYPDLYAKG